MLATSQNFVGAGYNDYPTVYSTADLCQHEFFRNTKTAFMPRPTTSAKFFGATSHFKTASGSRRLNTGVSGRPGTGALSRPMTAVRSAGFTSSTRRSVIEDDSLDLQDTPKQKIEEQQRKIMTLVEESVKAAQVNNKQIALKRAKEAESLERSLKTFEDRVELSCDHDYYITHLVLHNLAIQYANQKMYQEAIAEYAKLTRNKNFGDTAKLKINIGNIYVEMGNLPEAIKMYQMAFDQTSVTQKQTRKKIVNNIGKLFVRMGRFDEAAEKFAWVMKEKPELEAGMHVILCNFALARVAEMKRGFLELLDIPLPINSTNEYNMITDDIAVNVFNETIQNDDLSKFERELKAKAEKIILSCANLIAPVIEETFAQGFAWCAEAIKYSSHSALATKLEIDRVMVHLHNGKVQTAIKSLKDFENLDADCESSSFTVLSFINFLRKDYQAAEKYAQIAKNKDNTNPAAYVNLSACSIVKNELTTAENLLLGALKREPNHVQALYNLGLVYKRKDMFDEALQYFLKLTQISHNDPLVFYQMGHINQLRGSIEEADRWYNQLLALIPLDPGVFQKLGEMYDNISDAQRAYHYYNESYRAYPANFDVIYWLRSYCMSMKNFGRALEYSFKGVELTPGQPEWRILAADCLKKSGDIHEALAEYYDIYQQFPQNIHCLRSLYELNRNLGYKDAKKYAQELLNLQKTSKNRGDRVGSGKSYLSRSNTAMSSGSGKSIVTEDFLGDNHSNYSVSRPPTSNCTVEPSFYDTNVVDSFGALLSRPMTAVGRRDDDFGDEELGEDLLPE